MNIGQYLSSMGRGGDTMVAHINPKEAMILKLLGGRGSVNPRTGLREFDDGGGGGSFNNDPTISAPPPTVPITNATPSSFVPSSTGYSNALNIGTPFQSALANSYGIWNQLPSNAAPIDPSLFNQSSTQFDAMSQGEGGGASTPFLRQESQWIATPDNPNFIIGPNGYATLSPTGQSAYDTYVQQQQAEIAKNAAGIKSGIGGFLSTPLGGLSMLGLPLAIGGGVAALGGAGIADFGSVGAGAAGGDFGLGTGGLGVSPGLIAENTAPDASLGFGGGGLGATGATLPAADTLGFSGDTLGLGGDTASSLGFDTNPVFFGATDSTGAAAGDVGLGAGGNGIAPGLIASDAVSPTSAAGISAGGDFGLGAGGYGVSPGLIADNTIGADSSLLDSIFGKGIGDFISSNPLKALGMVTSAGGLVSDLFNKNNSGLNQNALTSQLQNAASNLAAGGVGGANAAALTNTANNLNAQGQKLASYLQNGTLPPGVQQAINASADAAKAAVKSRYAAMGIEGSSAMQQDLQNVTNQAVAQGTQTATQLLSQGASEQQVAAQIYGELQSSAVQQTGMSDQLYAELLQLAATQNQQFGQAIGNFASSLANVGRPLVTLQAAA